MSPILGIWASAQQGTFSGSFESIATVTVGAGGSSSISFSSIPSTYKHLQIRITGIAGAADAYLYFNSDTTNANYYSHSLYGQGASALTSAANIPYLDEGGTATTAPQAHVIDILDYTNTNKYKTVRNLWGQDYNAGNTTGRVGLKSILWSNTAAISTITIANRTWSQYSSFALYGVRG